MIHDILKKLETIAPDDLRRAIERFNEVQAPENRVLLEGGHQALVVRSAVCAVTSPAGTLKKLHEALDSAGSAPKPWGLSEHLVMLPDR